MWGFKYPKEKKKGTAFIMNMKTKLRTEKTRENREGLYPTKKPFFPLHVSDPKAGGGGIKSPQNSKPPFIAFGRCHQSFPLRPERKNKPEEEEMVGFPPPTVPS